MTQPEVAERRPLPKDPERTRARILEAASAEFAESGLGGARVDRIAARAGTNVRMLYYYFGDKDGLFLAVLEHAYEDIRRAEQELDLDRVDPVEGVRRLVAFSWGYYFRNPHFIALLNSENLHKARHLKQSSRIVSMHSPLVDVLERLLRRGAQAGVFRADVDPVQLYITVAGMGYFYLSNRYTLGTIFEQDLLADESCATRVRHMTDVVLGYLRP